LALPMWSWTHSVSHWRGRQMRSKYIEVPTSASVPKITRYTCLRMLITRTSRRRASSLHDDPSRSRPRACSSRSRPTMPRRPCASASAAST
jgi:hypothetical protein